MKNKFAGKGTAIAVLVIIAVLSMTVLAGFASSPETYADTIASLDKKKITVMELTAATLAASTALSAVPGDATNPAANQIANLSNYLMIVVCAIFLEKFLLTVIGHVAFTYILPIACVLGILYVLTGGNFFKNLGIKLAVFSVVITLIIPASINVGEMMYATQEESVQQTIAAAQQDEANDKEESGLVALLSKAANNVTKLAETAKNMLNNFIDAIAHMIITLCIMPIAVVLLGLWMVKLMFGINVDAPVKKLMPGTYLKKKESLRPADSEQEMLS